MPDSPKTLRRSEERVARRHLLQSEHIASLTSFVYRIRRKFKSEEIPFFDPCDGGVNAKVLFFLEAPGQKAICTGFVSRNNPDETAKNLFELQRKANLDRHKVALWNIVPWYVGRNGRIRPVKDGDIKRAAPYLDELLDKKLLPNLRCVVLVGRKAELWRTQISRKDIAVVTSPHPSPVNLHTHRHARKKILEAWRKAASYL